MLELYIGSDKRGTYICRDNLAAIGIDGSDQFQTRSIVPQRDLHAECLQIGGNYVRVRAWHFLGIGVGSRCW